MIERMNVLKQTIKGFTLQVRDDQVYIGGRVLELTYREQTFICYFLGYVAEDVRIGVQGSTLQRDFLLKDRSSMVEIGRCRLKLVIQKRTSDSIQIVAEIVGAIEE